MVKSIFVHLDNSLEELNGEKLKIYTTYVDTYNAIKRDEPCIRTTQTAFLQFEYAERIFAVVNGETHEITMGDCEGTTREIRRAHNLQKMLIAGVFDWFDRNNEEKEDE